MAEIIKINDNTWRIEDDFVRFFLLTGDNKAALIDSGANCKNAKEVAQNITDLPLMLINTHGDGDHTSGTGEFSKIYMAKADFVNKNMKQLFPTTELIELNDGDILDLGNRKLDIISIPGHTRGSIAILDIQNRVLIAGDSVQSGYIYMFGNHRAPELFEESLIKLNNESARFDKIWASHDTPVLDTDYIEKVLESWREVINDEVDAENINLYGMPVKSYKTKYCGFYCDI